jgi:hypothetical protein
MKIKSIYLSERTGQRSTGHECAEILMMDETGKIYKLSMEQIENMLTETDQLCGLCLGQGEVEQDQQVWPGTSQTATAPLGWTPCPNGCPKG